MTSKPSSINLHAKQKGKGLVLTFGYLLDQKVTYLWHKITHLIMDQVEFGLDQRRLKFSFVKTNLKTLTHWPLRERKGWRWKGGVKKIATNPNWSRDNSSLIKFIHLSRWWSLTTLKPQDPMNLIKVESIPP